MKQRDLNIIVCTDPRKCAWAQSYGRTGQDLLAELQQQVADHNLEDTVQVTRCRCIFGCTFGPRIDVAKRESGEKILYAIGTGEATITRRGRVKFQEIPLDLSDIIFANFTHPQPPDDNEPSCHQQ